MVNETLYLHIGAPKTGTTALQRFLANNRKTLISRGFCYPGYDEAHWDICTFLARDAPPGIHGSPDKMIPRYLDEMRRSSCHTLILSAEYLSLRGNAEALRDLIPGNAAIKIVYYARRQDFLIESHYNQRLKSPLHRTIERLDGDALDDICSVRMYDHCKVISPWADAFGKENIVIRCYEDQQMNGDIVRDFARIIGLSLEGPFSVPEERINPSLDNPHAEFLRVCNNAFLDTPGITDLLIASRFYYAGASEKPPGSRLLSPKARIAVLEHFEESNRAIAREYLGRADGRLFYDPWPDPNEPWAPYRGISTGELAMITDEIIARLDDQRVNGASREVLNTAISRALRTSKKFIPKPVWNALGKRADQLNR